MHWKTKRTSLLAVILVFLVASAFWLTPKMFSDSWYSLISEDRLRLVALNSFAVTHPDFQVDFIEMKMGGLLDNELDSKSSLPLVIEERNSKNFSRGAWIRTAVSLNSAGHVSGPHIGQGRISRLLQRSGADSSRNVEKLVSSVDSQNLDVQVLVKLKSAITEHEISALVPPIFPPDMIFVSPDSFSGKPILWDRQDCTLRGLGKCINPNDLTSQFAQWVSLLRPEDDVFLVQYGLKLQDLRKYAEERKIYGFTVTAPPEDLKLLFRHPNVEAVNCVSIDLSGALID